MLLCNRAIIREWERERERVRKWEKARKSKLASLKNKDKKSKMIGKLENEETVREIGSVKTDAQKKWSRRNYTL